ncbi:hypothetical protein BH10CYA1_BH10CYA1_46010 [soil metagenome]
MKLTLLHKGLILVCIPLCFEILVFSYLINVQNQVELEAQKINRNKKINDKVNLIFSDIFSVVNLVRPTSSDALATSFIPKRVFASVADLSKRFDELEVLAQDEPEMLHNIREGKAEINLTFEVLKKMKSQLLKDDPSDISQTLHDSTLNAELHLQRLMNVGIFDWATKNQTERELLRKDLWEQIRIILECGLALSLLFGIAGSFLLSKQLMRRASHLTENAVLMGQGKPLLPVLVGTDELAQLDRNFHQAASLLEAAKRMRQEVTAMITHDLRMPLQTVLGFLEKLGPGRFGELNALGRRFLPITLNSCNHMSNLIDNVLQLERLRSGSIRLTTSQVDLTAFLEKCISSVQLLAEEKNISVTLNRNSENPPLIKIDPFWMEQVVVNILSNAVKFSPKGSSILIDTSDEVRNSIIRIADQGPGIPADEQKLIFDRLYRMQSTASAPGTGLGLAIAKELVELHGGSIGVESIEGQGATFLLKLPRSNSSSKAASEPAARPNKKPALKLLHKGFILISIPLCFEITIFSLLLNLQNQVEQEANRIDHNRQVNDSANLILRDLVHVGLGLRRLKRKNDENQFSENQFRSLFTEILRNLQKLEKLVENEDLENQVKRGEHGVQMLAEKLASQSREVAVREQLITDLLSMMSYIAKRSIDSEHDLHGSELRAQSRMLLEIAISISVMFSFLGAVWYSRQIVSRLNKLSENAKLMAEDKPLLAPVQGSDEIAELDKSFHEAADKIETAKKIRQEATVMITHDLKTPLQSLRSFMEMLEDGSFGEIDEDGTKLRLSCRSSIQRMEDLINSVLQMEKLRSEAEQVSLNQM